MSKKGKHHRAGDKQPKTLTERIDRVLQSQLVLGALVALLTIANGFVTFRSIKASLASSTVDFYAAREMQQASILHLTGNAKYMIDLTAYSGYRLLEDRDPELAEESLNRGSEELLAGMERPEGPFDEAYNQARYGEARSAMEKAQELYAEADQASKRVGAICAGLDHLDHRRGGHGLGSPAPETQRAADDFRRTGPGELGCGADRGFCWPASSPELARARV